MKNWCLVILALCSQLLTVDRGVSSPAEPLTVCEVIRDRTLLSGTVVSVRGEWVSGEHYSALGATCSTSIVTEGLTWPNLIVLLPAQGKEAKFFDAEGMKLLTDKVLALAKKTGSSRIVVTVTGRVEGANRLEAFKNEFGAMLGGSGYGFAGRFPVELSYRSMADPVALKVTTDSKK